jgi:sulfite reductase alpha subunit-like flavoprotein
LVFEVKIELGRSVTRDRLDVGQSVAVFPKNRVADVQKIIQLFGWNKD